MERHDGGQNLSLVGTRAMEATPVRRTDRRLRMRSRCSWFADDERGGASLLRLRRAGRILLAYSENLLSASGSSPCAQDERDAAGQFAFAAVPCLLKQLLSPSGRRIEHGAMTGCPYFGAGPGRFAPGRAKLLLSRPTRTARPPVAIRGLVRGTDHFPTSHPWTCPGPPVYFFTERRRRRRPTRRSSPAEGCLSLRMGVSAAWMSRGQTVFL